MSKTRRLGAAAAAGAVAVVALVSSPAGAAGHGVEAAITTRFVGSGDAEVRIRKEPTTTIGKVGTLRPSARITIVCQIVGGPLKETTYRNDRVWDRLENGAYVHDMLTTTAKDGRREAIAGGGYAQWTADIETCPASSDVADPAAVAAAWAKSEVGVVDATAHDVAGIAGLDWKPGSVGEWSGDSMKFAAAAWAAAGQTLVKEREIRDQCDDYDCTDNAGTEPPAGAVVFWPDAGENGQEAISAGGGFVYAPIGADGHEVPVSRVSLDFFATPVGWAIP